MRKPIKNAQEKLLVQGRKALIDRGYDNFNMKDLAEECGMATGSIYSYFACKDDLVLQIMGQDWDQVIAVVRGACSQAESLKTRLSSVYDSFCAFEDRYRLTYGGSSRVSGKNAAAQKASMEQMYAAMADLIRGERDNGRLKADTDPEAMAYLITQLFIAGGRKEPPLAFDTVWACLDLEEPSRAEAAPETGKTEAPQSEAPSERENGVQPAPETHSQIEWLNGELRRQVEEYDMLMASTGVCIVKVAVAEGLPVLWCNEATHRAIGYTKEEYEALYGCKLRGYFQDREAPFVELTNALRTAFDNHEVRFEALIKLPTRQGFFWSQITGTFTDYDPETLEPTHIYGVFTDVTAIVAAREQLAAADRQKTRLANLLDNIPAGVCACSIAGGITQSITINRHLARHLGLTSGVRDFRDMEQLLAYIHKDERDHCRLLLMAFFRGSGDLNMNYRLRLGKTDSFLWMHTEGRLIHASDDTTTAYLTFTNITDLKETQKILDEAVSTAQLIAWSYDIPSHTITMADNVTTDREWMKFGFPRVIPGVPEALAEYVAEDSMDDLRALYRRVDAGEGGSCDIWYKQRPGWEPHCERVTYSVECDEDGRALRAFAVGMNITAEKMMAQRYNHIYTQIGDIYPNLIHSFHLNLTQNRFLSGQGQPDLIAGLLTDGTADHFIEEIGGQIADEATQTDFFTRFSRQAMMDWYMNGQTTNSLKYRTRSADGSTHQRNGFVNLARNPGTGDIEATIYELNGDVEMDLENMVRAISQGAYGFIILVDTITGMIRFGGDTTGNTPEQYHNEDYAAPMIATLKQMMPPDLLEESITAHSLDNLKAQLRKDPNYQLTYPTTDGRWLQWRFAYVDEEQTQMLIQRADITEAVTREKRQNKQLQDALNDAAQANEMKSSFLSSMSHDMRTPLNGILRFTDFALATEDPAKKQDYLEKIRSSGDLLLNLVSDTLDLSRIESGKLTLNLETTSTRKCGNMVVETLRPMAEEKGVRLIADPFPDGTIRVDVLKIQKIWLNLLSNAIKYTPAGGTVRAGLENIDPPEQGCTRRLIIEDDGIGMSEAFMENMFEPFAQENRPEAWGVTGTGLGLAIVKRYVDFLGGTIAVESAVGKGTRFTVCLPIEKVTDHPELEAEPLAEAPAPVSLEGRRVLLCEDNRLNTEIATILLKDRGVAVETAVDGEEGLNRFAASDPWYYDAILMDIRMPVMDGHQAARTIRALDRPDAAAVPIVAMTADAFAEDIERAKESGMDGYVTKPIAPDKLYRTLEQVMGDGKPSFPEPDTPR